MIELAYSLDRRRIQPHVATELSCHLELRPRGGAPAQADGLVTNLCLVLDCSGSMAGAKAEAAIEAAHLIVNTIDDRHRVSLVGFATSHWVLVDNARFAETGREPIRAQIERLRTLIRGGTNLAEGIRRGIRTVRRHQADANVIVVLSDGEADAPEEAVRAGREASDEGVQVFAIGVGDDFKADDLLRIVRPSNGAVLGERDADKLKSAFDVLLRRIESFVATNAQLEVTLHAGVHPGALHKTAPERAFLGNLTPGDRTIRLTVGNIERGQPYSFLLALTPPIGGAGEREIARASVRYDVPAQRERGLCADVAIAVVYDERGEDAKPAVAQVHRRAKLAELVDELAESERQQTTERSTQLLAQLVRQSEDQGDARMVAELRGVAPPIPQAKLNALVLAATARGAAPPPPAPEPPPPASPHLFDVVLVQPGGQVIELMREIRELTGLGLARVHELITGAPAVITALPERDAAALKARLEAAGARIEVEPKRS